MCRGRKVIKRQDAFENGMNIQREDMGIRLSVDKDLVSKNESPFDSWFDGPLRVWDRARYGFSSPECTLQVLLHLF